MEINNQDVELIIEKFFEEYKKNAKTTFVVDIRGIISGFWIFGMLFACGFVQDVGKFFDLSSDPGFWEVVKSFFAWVVAWPIAFGEEIARIIASG